MLGRKVSRKFLTTVPEGGGGTVMKIQTEEEKLQDDIKIQPQLQSTLEGFDELLKLLGSPGGDKNALMKTFEVKFEKAFETFTTDHLRGIMGNYLALRNFAERLYDLYEFVVTAGDIKEVTSDFLHKHKDTLEVRLLLEIRKALWTCSDTSYIMCERIANTNMFKYLLGDVTAIGKTLPIIAEDDLAFDTAVGILYNCSRHHVTRPRYRELKAVDTLLPFLKAKSAKIKLLTLLLLAHIVDESKNKLFTADITVFDFLIEMIAKSWENVDHRCYHGNTFFSSSELLNGLTALAKNDANKQLLMKKGAMTAIEKFLKKGTEVEQEEALNCVRELAFDEENKSSINANKDIMNVLKEKEDSGNKQIAKAAQFTRWGLATKKVAETNLQRKQSLLKGRSSGHVMMSYSWSNQSAVLQIYEGLKAEGYRIWIDVDNMAGSTLGAMAEAVEKASMVLIFVSEMYFDSQNCRQEAEYTYKLKKPMIPVYLQANYTPVGWLGIMLGTKLYFDFSPGKYKFNTKLKDLVKEIGDNGRITEEEARMDALAPSSGPSIQPTASEKRTDRVAGWTSKDVEEWLKNIKMYHCSALRRLSGEELLFLQHLSDKAPEFYYGYLERNMKMKILKDLMIFTNALKML